MHPAMPRAAALATIALLDAIDRPASARLAVYCEYHLGAEPATREVVCLVQDGPYEPQRHESIPICADDECEALGRRDADRRGDDVRVETL